MLILQFSATLLNSFIDSNSNSFLVESLVSSIQNIMSSVNQECFLLPFQSGCCCWFLLLCCCWFFVFCLGGVVVLLLLFFVGFFSYFPWLKCFSIILTVSAKRGHSYLVPDLRGKALSFPKIHKLDLSIILALGLYRCPLKG